MHLPDEEGERMISDWKTEVDRLAFQRGVAEETLKREEENLKRAAEYREDVEETQIIVQTVAQAVQQQIHNRVAGVVSQCLEAVFDDPYEFQIVFEQKRGKTEARLVFVRDGLEVDPMTASGGGVVDVAAFALRLSSLLLLRPAVRRVIVADEPFRFVSAQYRGRIRAMLEGLAEDMGIQFIIVTHIDDLKMGTIVDLSRAVPE